jgi:hypothetical protein
MGEIISVSGLHVFGGGGFSGRFWNYIFSHREKMNRLNAF